MLYETATAFDPGDTGSCLGLRGGTPLARKFVDLPDGRTVSYVEAGSGPDVVLIHGALMTLEDMALGPMAALAERFHVVAVDRPGHGESTSVRLKDASIWCQARIIRDAARVLGLERPVVVGHSFGGAVALAYGMSDADAVTGIVALAPICLPEARLEQMLFGARALPFAGEVISQARRMTSDPLMLTTLWRTMFLPQIMPERFAAAFPFALAGRAEQMVSEGENASALLPDLTRSAFAYARCRVPVLILGGSADIVVNNAVHGQIAAALMPQGRFEWLPGLGHMLHHFRIEKVVEAVDLIANQGARRRHRDGRSLSPPATIGAGA